jgi:phage-related minor tail protein
VTNTKTASQAFTDMANSIIKDIARMVIRQSITGPLAGILGSALGGFGGGSAGVLTGGSPLGFGGIGHNAGGTDNWRGGPTWVGENGPELINLPRGSQVVPNDVVKGGQGGGDTVINLGGIVMNGNGETDPKELASAILAQARAQIVPTVRDAQRRRVL